MKQQCWVARTQEDLERCLPVLQELRPHLSAADYHAIYREAHAHDHYEIVALERDGQILGIMGYRLLTDFVRGRHVYVDDLVTSQQYRSQGVGAQLLQYAESVARENNCNSLRLCTGIDNLGGMAFYEREGWSKRAFAYSKKLAI